MRLNLAQRIPAVKVESSSSVIRDVSGEMSRRTVRLGLRRKRAHADEGASAELAAPGQRRSSDRYGFFASFREAEFMQ